MLHGGLKSRTSRSARREASHRHDLAPRWGSWLRDEGIDAVHWSDVGPADATDAALFAYAREQGLVVFTHDLDLVRS